MADTERWLPDTQSVAVHRERQCSFDGQSSVVKAMEGFRFGSQQLLGSHFPPLASYHPSYDRKSQSEPQAFLSLLGESGNKTSQEVLAHNGAFPLKCVP